MVKSKTIYSVKQETMELHQDNENIMENVDIQVSIDQSVETNGNWKDNQTR